jgi:hypothetical protein
VRPVDLSQFRSRNIESSTGPRMCASDQAGGRGFESLKLHQTVNNEKALAEMRGLFCLIVPMLTQ